MLQVCVDQVLQVAVQAQSDEDGVQVQAQRGAVLGDRRGGGEQSSPLSQPPEQLVQVRQLPRDEQTSPE